MKWVFGPWGIANARASKKSHEIFTRVAFVMVVAGFVLSCIWSRENLGTYFQADPRELGAIMVGLWLAVLWKTLRSGNCGKQRVMLLSVGASLASGLAWFGAPLLGANPNKHSYGFVTLWPLILFVLIHVVFMLVAVLRGEDRREVM